MKRAVHRDGLLLRVDLRAEFADDPPVHADAPGRDEFVAVPPRADAGVGEVFVEADHDGPRNDGVRSHTPNSTRPARACLVAIIPA